MSSTERNNSVSRINLALTLGVAVLTVITPVTGSSPTSHGFDKAFYDFLYEHGYVGGAVAAMKDRKLLFAKGYGEDTAGKQVTANSKFHISSLAKSLTAVATMRLVQLRRINLDDKVFGKAGLLKHITPWREETVDERLSLITVDHLLRHTTGWDVDQGPLYDPLLNKLYLARGHDVPDIAGHMSETHPIKPETLISYVISQPLDFTPGTKTAYSNIAYLVLGRVVEAGSKMEYREFVKKYILAPCGMWNTHLELSDHGDFPGVSTSQTENTDDQPLFRDIDTLSVDSALGWFSTVYDLMRFTRCTFEAGQLLNRQHLKLLLARRGTPSSESLDPKLEARSETWDAAGFLTNSHGIVWQDSDTHADDLILYHDLHPQATSSNMSPTRGDARRRRQRREDKGSAAKLVVEQAESRESLPDSWVVLLHGKKINHLRHHTRNLMRYVDTSEDSLPQENLFLRDLSDLHRHPSWDPDMAWSWRQVGATPGGGVLPVRRAAPEITVRYKVDEQDLSAYVDALKNEGFDVQWLTSNPQEASFVVMGKRIERPKRAKYDFIFKHGLDHRRLLRTKLWLERGGYNLTQLHSYVRSAKNIEDDKKSKWTKEGPLFAAVFRYKAFPQGTQMKYGTGHLPEPYHKLVQMYHEKEFYPLSQTITWAKSQKVEEFAFVFIKRADVRKPKTEFRQYYDLTADELAQTTVKTIKSHLRLAHLNSYQGKGGKSRFSAVYTNSTRSKGMLELDQPLKKASEMTIFNMRMGLAPKFMVPYKESGRLRYAIYFEEF
ncbi:protein flp [Elysia marginata]|uniref:Protein flp n=1 Tax=Elysia marginata TaxID=1093978 RepID=A0AAV4FKH5_9GAST|nr:protein flp [Elysia marginata]